jgi:hypothetical protein
MKTQTVRERMQERERGSEWAKSLHITDVWVFVDQNVLGDFDWRDWFNSKPTGAFISAAFEHCQYREEMS